MNNKTEEYLLLFCEGGASREEIESAFPFSQKLIFQLVREGKLKRVLNLLCSGEISPECRAQALLTIAEPSATIVEPEPPAPPPAKEKGVVRRPRLPKEPARKPKYKKPPPESRPAHSRFILADERDLIVWNALGKVWRSLKEIHRSIPKEVRFERVNVQSALVRLRQKGEVEQTKIKGRRGYFWRKNG